MATACYPRNHSFTVKEATVAKEKVSGATDNKSSADKTKAAVYTKPTSQRNVMKCRHCHYRFPYPPNSFESAMMDKVADCTGPKAEVHYYCPSSDQVLDRLGKLRHVLSEKRFDRLLGLFAYYHESENCQVKFADHQKKKQETEWLNAQRAKYARKNKVVSEEDFPQHLQKLPSPRDQRPVSPPKHTMGNDSRSRRVEAPRHVVEDYYESEAGESVDY